MKTKTLKAVLSILIAFSLALSSCCYKGNISPVEEEKLERKWDKEHGGGGDGKKSGRGNEECEKQKK